ncbi:MAG: aldo/keto reductase [Campylobacterales bacterium]|nr:aldo/keto reductase [Campylobacterales bacterium]
MQRATKEGTFAYLKRFGRFSRDFYMYDGELFFSSLGLGTFRREPYREEHYLLNYRDALIEAVCGGINHIDTAINYRYQVSEIEIGEALKALFEGHGFKREELIIASKAGFIPLEFPFPDPYRWIESQMIEQGLTCKEEIVIDQHCMSPQFLRWSVERSLENMGLETLDICYLHNPETQLGYVDRALVMRRIRAAFETFEQLCDEGKIAAYGVAAWNGFLYEEEHMEYLSLRDIVALAKEAGGENHRLRYLQSPFNLAKTHALNYPNQKGEDGRYYSLLEACARYGLRFIASSALLQMHLFKGRFSATVREALGAAEHTDIGAALQFARSCGAVSALFGAVDPLHVKDNLLLSYLPKARHEGISMLFGGQDAL